jgi:hypothetical protein
MRHLFGLLGSPFPNEAEAARSKLLKLLGEHGLTWNDLPLIIAATDDSNMANNSNSANNSTSASPTAASDWNVLQMVMELVEEHVAVTAEERMAIGLWTLHTWVFDQFSITPRLVLLSPVSGCGKTTLLSLIRLLVAKPEHSDNTTAAAIYHALDQNPGATLLLDEGDNLGLFHNNVLRAVFNSGHRRGGSIDRFVGGERRKYGTFAPLALPQPLLHRAIEIHMQRQPRDGGIRRLDENDGRSTPADQPCSRHYVAVTSAGAVRFGLSRIRLLDQRLAV